MAALNKFKAFCGQVSNDTTLSGGLEQNTYIKKDNFSQQSADDKNKQHVEEPVLELAPRGTLYLGNDGGTKTLCRDNAESSDPAANRDVHQHIFLAPSWAGIESGNDRAHDDHTGVAEKPWCDHVMLHLLDVGDGRLRRGIHYNYHRTDNAEKAGNLSYHTQALLQKDGGQHRGDNDGQRTKRGD